MITVERLSKQFGNVPAVSDITFEVKSGEIIGFLGPNGAGKTTTMRMMTGYLAPDEGDVSINGISVNANPTAAQRQIGYLPESNPLYREMLVADFLALSADLKGIPKPERRKALEFSVISTGINEVYYRPIGELSKGYRQRVGLAAALLHEPQVLILDEPTEGLDPIQRNEIRSLILDLAKNRTIIMSTHVMQEVTAVCNRILILNKGKLVADGTPDNIGNKTVSERKFEIELEGSGITAALKKLKGVRHLEIHKIEGHRHRITLNTENDAVPQPELSRLIGEHGWTVWKLNESGRNLEDIFESLTKDKP